MNRQSIIVARFLLCAAAALGAAAWGGGKPEEKNPVKVVFVSVGMEKNSMWINGAPQESPLQLKFGVNFSVKSPWALDRDTMTVSSIWRRPIPPAGSWPRQSLGWAACTRGVKAE